MHLHPGKAVQVIDTVGAGDAFTAAVAIGLLKQFDLDYINDCANRVAAFVCSHKGATPTLNQKLSRLRSEERRVGKERRSRWSPSD